MAINLPEQYKTYKGEIEIIIKDRNGKVINTIVTPNLIKIFAKEMLSHRLPYSKVWVPDASSGGGAWVASDIDIDEEFSAKYILFGASFDDNGQPLNFADTRYYELDSNTQSYIPKKPDVGADNLGGLINAVPISEPDRPLKRIESISFSPSYQPSDSPLLADDVRAINNIVLLETTLRLDEYNGFNTSDSDYFTITEVALAGGKTIDTVGTCECAPHILFLEGVGGVNNASILAGASGSATVSIDGSVSIDDVNRIKEGDQILIVGVASGTEDYDTLSQVSPYYLVLSKEVGGRDMVLDRTPVDSDGNALTGNIGVYRNSLRLFSQRILSTPVVKSSIYELLIRWRIIMA